MTDNELFASLCGDAETATKEREFRHRFRPPPATNPESLRMMREALTALAAMPPRQVSQPDLVPPRQVSQPDLVLAGPDQAYNLTTTADAVLEGNASLEQLDIQNDSRYPTLEEHLAGCTPAARPYLSRVDFLKHFVVRDL